MGLAISINRQYKLLPKTSSMMKHDLMQLMHQLRHLILWVFQKLRLTNPLCSIRKTKTKNPVLFATLILKIAMSLAIRLFC
ncbi:hypothetical protein DBB33_13505 [Chromobacterium haemolyticum]|nr:hypothetical protein DBB33_13505 [Chromobacterium haemolyticum]